MSDDATGVPDTAAAMIAEQWARQHARDAYDSDLDDYGRQMLAVLIAEYDRRGAALAQVADGLRAALAGSGTAGDTPPSQSVHDAAMKAAVRARDEWRAAEQGPIEGHPDGPECLAIAEAVLDVVRSAESGAGWPGLGVSRKSY